MHVCSIQNSKETWQVGISLNWLCHFQRIYSALFTPITITKEVTQEYHTCQLSRIIRESPEYDNNLPVSRTGHPISRIKSSYELFCALIWNLSHFLPTFCPKIRILFDSKFVFWGIFACISSLTKISLRLPS